MNVPKIKGTHSAMKSAMLAADAVWDKLQAADSITQGQEKKNNMNETYDMFRVSFSLLFVIFFLIF